ncbi:MAG: hypothetical protein LBQ61_01035 [Spirochaetales bacterium]|jgi:hypothetical protein|nr:hypothetical protein [Spirochaetales bacterium]
MSIRPIEMQTLFTQLNQAGKEQAVEKNSASLLQSQQFLAAVRQAEQRDTHINETEKTESDLNSVGEEGAGPGGQEPKHRPHPPEAEDREDRENIEDPDLGRHLDITG